jgi:D-alanyl-D-alanine endopeptidase (penicillin-binding protein 7)
MNRFIDSLGWTLIHFAWQGALVAAIAALAFAFFRNSRPQLRYLIGCLALLACIAWPLLEFHARWVAYHRYAEPGAASQMLRQLLVADDPIAPFRDKFGLIVALWTAGASMLALRMGAGLLWVRRLANSACRDIDGLQQRFARLAALAGVDGVRLRVVAGLEGGPLAIGLLRPLVVVPASLATGMAPHMLEALLAHELGHIRHHDYLVNLLQNAVETLLFYHPAVWWLSARVRVEREHMADDFAAGLIGDRRTVALALSQLEKARFSPAPLAQAAGGGNLAMRVRRLVLPQAQGLNMAALLPVVGALLAGLTVYANAAVDTAGSNRKPLLMFSSCTKPMYPDASLANGDQGTVAMAFRVGADGTVLDSRIARSSGHRELDRAAHAALKRCRFEPGLRHGRAVDMTTNIQYVWTLE